MAKVSGPLFSIAAHGTLGEVITYSKRCTHHHVRFQKKQKRYTNTASSLQKIKFGAAGSIWANLTQEQKDELAELLRTGQ